MYRQSVHRAGKMAATVAFMFNIHQVSSPLRPYLGRHGEGGLHDDLLTDCHIDDTKRALNGPIKCLSTSATQFKENHDGHFLFLTAVLQNHTHAKRSLCNAYPHCNSYNRAEPIEKAVYPNKVGSV